MAITTVDQLVAAARQRIPFVKTAARTTVAASWFTTFDLAGQPGAGTLAVGNTANGLVPTDATAGFPLVNTFGGSATGYVGVIDFSNSVACRMTLYDRLFHAGAYAFNAATTLASIPSYSGRVPSGTDFTNTEIWIETVTAFTGNLSVAIGYTNQSGTAGRSTGTFATGTALTVGRMMQIPLQAGDTGVQVINSVTASVATVGTFNVLVIRPLWSGRVRSANDGDLHGWDKVGLPPIYDTSALQVMISADSTSSGTPEMSIQILNG
jgi:hypothetical protein